MVSCWRLEINQVMGGLEALPGAEILACNLTFRAACVAFTTLGGGLGPRNSPSRTWTCDSFRRVLIFYTEPIS